MNIFVTFTEATALDAKSLTESIVKTLTDHKLDMAYIVSQGYDGASVMSEHCTGIQTRLKEFAPHAIYIHCNAHILNLVLVDSVKAVPGAAQFFALVKSLYVFLATTKAHVIFLQKQKELHPDKPTQELQRLSDTHWACRYSSVNATCYTFDAILATLEEMSEDSDGMKATQATGLLLQIKTFHFLLSLITFDKILSITKGLSDVLQSATLHLGKAADLVSGTIQTIKDFRTDRHWCRLFTYVESVAKLHNIEITEIRLNRKRKLPSCLREDTIILESTGSHEQLTTSQQFKASLYYPILDAFLMELNHRFGEINVELMRAIHACDPQSSHFLDPEQLQPLVDYYNLDCESVRMELILSKRTLNKKKLSNTADVFKELSPLKEAFPTLLKVIQIALTICVSSAFCERSFSALKRVKNYLRSTMQEERLINLAVLSVEREISSSLDLEDAINKFSASDKDHRITLS